MRFAGFSALALLLASSSAIPTKRQALIDSIGGSSLDDVLAEIKNNGNINLLGDLIEVAVDALSTEASAVAECFNPSASNALGSGSSGSVGAGAGVGVGGTGASSPSASAVVSELSNLLSSVASAATAGPDAAAAASSALNFLSTAGPAASVAPGISSLLSSIADNTAAIPTGAASSLAGAASGVPSQLSSLLGSLATEVAAQGTAAPNAAGQAASSALGFLSTANPAASVAPAISSLLSSIAADPSATIPANVASSLANAASSVAANLPGVTAGAGAGVGVGGSVGGIPNPALSSLLSDPAVTGAPALSSAIGSLTNPGASVGLALSSALSSILANPSVSLPTAVVSSLVSAISSAANNGGGIASPATNTRGSSAASSSSTPITCPFASKSTYSVLGSQFTRYCNEFYGGNVLNLGNAVLKRQAGGSLNTCASICGPDARCLGTQYNPSTGACTFYSTLTNGVTRNGVQFAVRSSAASSILPPVSASATGGASAGVSAGVPSGALSSLASEASTATGALGSQLSSLVSQLSTAKTINTGALSSLISELPTATSVPTGLISSLVNPASTSRRPSLPGLSGVPSQVSSIVGGLTSATSLGSSAISSLISQITGLPTNVVPTSVASSLASEISGISTAVNPSSVISSIVSQITDPASSVLSSASSEIASITSGLGSITGPITLPPGATATAITTSCGGALVDLCATIGLLDGIPVNLGIGGIGGATPTRYSGASGLYTATSTQCSGVVCLAVGVGPSVTATLGALQPDGSILDLGAAVGGITSGLSLPTTLPGGDVITSTSTSCNGAVCLEIGVGPSATVTLGALNTDGSLINIGAGITPALPTGASVPTTLPNGDVITSTSASCDSVLCLALGVGPSTTVTLGALNTDGSIVNLGAGLGGVGASITAAPSVTAGASVSFPDITAVSTSCNGAVCATLGLGPLATVTLGAIATDGSGGLVDLSAGVLATPTTVAGAEITAVSTTCDSLVCLSLGVGPLATVTLGLIGAGGVAGVSAGVLTTPAITAPAVVPTSAVVDGTTITAISQSCGVGGVVDACVSLGLGPLGTITLGADALGSSGLASAGVSATLLPGVTLTNGQVVPTSIVANGNTITAVSASCSGAAVNVCVTLGLGNIATVTLNAGVLPTSGGIASVSAGVGASGTTAAPAVTSPAVLTTIDGQPVTAFSTSCGTGSLANVCATVALGPVGTISLNAGVLGSSGLANVGGGLTVLKREPTTLAKVVRK